MAEQDRLSLEDIGDEMDDQNVEAGGSSFTERSHMSQDAHTPQPGDRSSRGSGSSRVHGADFEAAVRNGLQAVLDRRGFGEQCRRVKNVRSRRHRYGDIDCYVVLSRPARIRELLPTTASLNQLACHDPDLRIEAGQAVIFEASTSWDKKRDNLPTKDSCFRHVQDNSSKYLTAVEEGEGGGGRRPNRGKKEGGGGGGSGGAIINVAYVIFIFNGADPQSNLWLESSPPPMKFLTRDNAVFAYCKDSAVFEWRFEEAKKQAAEEAKKRIEEAKKRAEEAEKQAAEEAEKQIEEAKKRAAEAEKRAAEEARKRIAAEERIKDLEQQLKASQISAGAAAMSEGRSGSSGEGRGGGAPGGGRGITTTRGRSNRPQK